MEKKASTFKSNITINNIKLSGIHFLNNMYNPVKKHTKNAKHGYLEYILTKGKTQLEMFEEKEWVLISDEPIMTNKEYIENVLKTESRDFNDIRDRLGGISIMRLLHGAMGVCTEGGELLDTLKKYIYYDKDIDETNLKEEIGDLLWYCSILIDELGTSFEEIQKRNIEKLKSRYGEKFNKGGALKRDLKKERKILEK